MAVVSYVLKLRGFRLPPESRREVRSQGYYAASSGNSLLTFRDSLSVQKRR